MGATTIVLVRHGQSRWNAAGLMQGQQGPGLSPRGQREAEVTATALAHRYGHAAAIVRSDLPRVAETAAPAELALQLDATEDQRLRELDLGSWSGREHADVRATHGPDFERWERGGDVDSHGGETFSQVQARVAAALDDVAARHDGDTVVVFSHGGPIRMATATALGLAPTSMGRLEPPPNCSITVLAWEAGNAGKAADDGDTATGRRRVVTYAESQHLAEVHGRCDADLMPRSAGGRG